MAAPTEVLPPGNRWEFSNKNRDEVLRKTRFTKEIPNPTDDMQKLVVYLQSTFLMAEWEFVSLIQVTPRESGPEIDPLSHLVAVFTNPTRDILTRQYRRDIDQLVRPEVLRQARRRGDAEIFDEYFPVEDPINQVILKGTNVVASGMQAGYNGVNINDITHWQGGVGYIDVTFESIDHRLTYIGQKVDKKLDELEPILASRAVLRSLQDPNPRQLFQ